MRSTSIMAAMTIVALSGTLFAATGSDPLASAIKAPSRTATNVRRDQYRHPYETLSFFGVKPTDTIVEIWPGGGWYSEILSPYAAGQGTLWEAAPNDKALEPIRKMQAAHPSVYAKVRTAIFPSVDGEPGVPAGKADVVLTFRNVHNWRFGKTDQTQIAFDQMFAMLKPGGTLGIVEHRLPEAMSAATEGKSGYVKRSSVVEFATKAGFRLVGESKVNANPKDTHDYPGGVWTLPPTYTEKDVNKAKYAAIGESDRMTLKFIKPRT